MVGYNGYGMATYKVLQDIEAEDKLIGPLTLRQFIYAGIGAVFLYLSYLFATGGAVFMLPIFLPVVAITAFFAFPWMRDQPTEVWALAKIRFLLKPRKRIWNQSDIKEMVTITAPKQVTVAYTDGLTQSEVRSRLRALATTVDTRGWAIKNANINMSTQTSGAVASDRLVSPATSMPKQVDDTDIRASDDIMDEKNNADAQRLQSMIDEKARTHRNELVASLNDKTPPPAKNKAPTANDYWFLNQPAAGTKIPNDMVTFNTQVVTPGAEADIVAPAANSGDEAGILAELEAHKQQSAGSLNGHLHTIQPLSRQAITSRPATQPTPQIAPPISPPQPATPAISQNASAPVTPPNQTAILHLANNNDLDVATIAREAKRATSQGEVVIKLH